jgi:hypothetical protein
MAEFTIECFHNEFLPSGASVMHAVVTVTAAGTPAGEATTANGSTERSELVILDVSGSMNGKRLRAAKDATAAAVDCVPDGTRFGIITGNHEAERAYPEAGLLAVASASTRAEAKAALKRVEARGGTAMGTWIAVAADVFAGTPGIRHAILLTDGKNESESPEDLEAVLASVEGMFQCDCRGVGSQWQVSELRKVATALLGTVDVVAEPEGLRADFTNLMQEALGKHVAEVALRVWTPLGGEVVTLKQMEPPLDLTVTRAEVDPLTGVYGTGSWGNEARDFLVSVRVPPGEVGQKRLCARLSLLVGGEPSGEVLVPATWTDDETKSTHINKRVAAARGETEIADAIQEGVDALKEGDVERGTDRLGKAAAQAHAQGNEEALERIGAVVDIEDPVTGRVRAKRYEEIDLQILETRSTRTSKKRSGER